MQPKINEKYFNVNMVIMGIKTYNLLTPLYMYGVKK